MKAKERSTRYTIRETAKAYAVAGLLALPACLLGVLTLAAIGLLLEALQ